MICSIVRNRKGDGRMFNFNHVTISVDKLEESLEFYKKFGFVIYKEYHDDNVDIVMMKLSSMILEISYYEEYEKLPEHSKNLGIDLKTIGNKHFGLGVSDINDAKKFIEEHHLSDSEITITNGRLGKPYFLIKDPNGILMEIIEED